MVSSLDFYMTSEWLMKVGVLGAEEGGGGGRKWSIYVCLNVQNFQGVKKKYFKRSRYKIPKEYQVGVGWGASEFIRDLLNLRWRGHVWYFLIIRIQSNETQAEYRLNPV